MDILAMSIGYLLLGLFFSFGIFLIVAVCYSTLYHMREDQIKDNRSDTSWNDEDKFFDTVEEFRSDFV